jgi:hypothetical protein
MAGTQNSISSLVAQFLRLQKNALEIINGLNEVATSTNDTVSIQILDENGNPQNANVPGYGFVRQEISRLDNNIRALAGLGSNSSTVRNPDGTYSQIFKSRPLSDPSPLKNLAVPSTFGTKDNWFFESFLSPLLYVSLDVTGKIPDDSDRILVKRVIVNTQTQAEKDFFDQNLSGLNNLVYNSFINQLDSAGLAYFFDEDIIPLPLRELRYSGSFSVFSFYDDVVSTTDVNGQINQSTVRNYKLNRLTYTDNSTTVTNGKVLNTGDFVSTPDGSIYIITSVNTAQSSIQVKRISGYQPITIGGNSLKIYSEAFGPRTVDVNIGYDERQAVFFKTIDDNFNIVSTQWSSGVSFWSNTLTTIDTTGKNLTLENFYLSQVADIGKVFLDIVKERKVPAIQGIKPDVPVLEVDNFKVVQINKQVTDSVSVKSATQKIAAKSTLKTEIQSLDVSINQAKNQLNQAKASSQSSGSSNSEGVNTLQANLNSLYDQRDKKVQLYSSVVNDISTTTKDLKQLTTDPKYRVRGFWDIPDALISPSTGPQNVIQFKIRYRYLSDSGSAQPTEQIQFKGNSGQLKTGAFSNWVEILSPIRKKVYDLEKGVYVWAKEETDNADAANVNQLDIPITKGERVEIQIASISEAGWPDNPQISDFSPSVIVQFPEEASTDSISDVLTKNNEDSAVVAVQNELRSQGLPQHLSEQFTEGTSTYYHSATNIASGSYTASGSTISLFDKINDLQNQINILQSLISVNAGVLEVYLLDGVTSLKVNKGQNVQLSAGFYDEIFAAPQAADSGKIATKTYLIQLYNSQTTPVELASIVPGGFSTQAPTDTYDSIQGYGVNLRYGDAPVCYSAFAKSDVESNEDLIQASGYQSAQTYGQFIYCRYKDVGLNRNLYLPLSGTPGFNDTYDYSGVEWGNNTFGVTGGLVPANGTCLIPYDPQNTPSEVTGGTGSTIWTGSWSSTAPLGGGSVSEFCIHTGHPALNTGVTGATFESLVKPVYDNGVKGAITYPYFRHAITFYADSSLQNFIIQNSYRTADPAAGATAESSERTDAQYPDKISFIADDEYLVGKYSCGAYLFLGPPEPGSLNVDGFSSLNGKRIFQGESNAIVLPVIFQFRATDKYGFIGGYRKSGAISNVKYTKKIGLDLQQRNQSVFSFDLTVTGQYRNETLIAPNFGNLVTPNQGTSVNVNNVIIDSSLVPR